VPSAPSEGHLPLAPNENGPDFILNRGVPGGDVEELLSSLQLIMTEFVY
jgi:hypothetical protein